MLIVDFGGTTLIARLTGNGIPALAFPAGSPDFGGTDVGTTVKRTPTLTNRAPGPVALPTFLHSLATTSRRVTLPQPCPRAQPVR